ncbi:hypothetical protein H0H92_003723 [Tricholoma furcatifolium]|nr:hypothetical protein H0H92_003723 [Tricholoma furcatifolium]
MSVHPWDEWHLDSKFLVEITAWVENNPKTSLYKIMEKICNAIEPVKEFFELVPDGAIPARGILKALAHVVQLGKAVASAERDVCDFALKVIQLVEKIQRAFSDGQRRLIKRGFTLTTWKNLQEIRDIVEEICKWAFNFLNKSTTLERLDVGKQIDDFNERIRSAQNMFNDNINRRLGEADARDEEKYHERRRAEEAEQRRKDIEHTLAPYVVADPSHGAQDKQSCAKHTRNQVLRDVNRWVRDLSSDSQNFLWLSGDPGCGKSAITASLAETARKENILWGEFFINRNNPNTTNPIAYFPTIASQLTKRSVESRREILDQLSTTSITSPLVSMSPENAAKYFVEAVCTASKLTPNQPVVIVIDGLDETDRQHLGPFATIFARLFNDGRFMACPNVKIFISSRTEDDIRNPFARNIKDDKHVKRVYLDTVESFHDVKEFMVRSLGEIWDKRSLPADKWPTVDKLKKLADQASGLFIWAVTALGYVQQRLDEDGEEGLSSLLDDFHTKELKGIDALYSFIVLETYKGRADGDIRAFQTFRRIVGAIVVLYEPLSLDNLNKILHLQQISHSEPVDIINTVRRLRTVLVSGTDAIHGQTIPRLHKSFFEYLTGGTVDERFKVDLSASHRELGVCCLHQVTLAPSAIASHKLPTVFRYASRFWSQHLSASEASLLSGIMIMDSNVLLNDVKAKLGQLSQSKPSSPSIGLSTSDSSILISILDQTCSWNVSSGLVQDGIDFREVGKVEVPKATSSNALQGQSPYQLKPTVAGSLPSNDAFISWAQSSSFERNRLGVWNVETGRLTTLETLNRTRKPVWSSCFGASFEDGQFAEVRDCIIRIWKVQSTTKATVIKSTNFQEATGNWEGQVSCLALSAMAYTLAVGCNDGTAYFWNIRGNAMQHIPSTLPEPQQPDVEQCMPITTLVFSPDGDTVLSLSANEFDIVIWSLRNNKYVASIMRTGLNSNSQAALHSISFLQDTRTVVSGHGDGTIRFWDVKSSEAIGKPLTTGSKDIISFVQHSINGDCIISGTNTGRIDVWDVETRQNIYSYRTEMPTTLSTCILTQRRSIHRLCIGGSSDLTMLELCGVHKDLTPETRPLFFALSLDGRKIATVSYNGVIHLRNAARGDLIAESSNLNTTGFTRTFNHRARDAAIFFNSDGILLTRSEGSLLMWETTNGKQLVCVSPPIQTTPPLFFNCNDYHVDHASMFHGVLWIPSKNRDSGLWVITSDRKLIQGHKDRTVIITGLADI